MGLISGLGKGIWNVGKGLGSAYVDIGKGLGKEAIHLGKNSPGFVGSNFATAIGTAAAGAAVGGLMTDEQAGENSRDRIGKGAIGGSLMGLSSMGAGAMGFAATGGLAAAGSALSNIYGIGAKSISLPKNMDSMKLGDMTGAKFTGFGKAMLGLGAVAQGVRGADEAFIKSRTGRSDGRVRSATPMIPNYSQQTSGGSYSNNGGATGDLVFALNNLRHG